MLSDHCSVLSVCDIAVLWPNGWMDQNETWHAGRPRPGHIVLDCNPAPPKGHSPQFSEHDRCGQTAGWIKIPLGTEVGLGPRDCVRWGLSSPQRGTAPNFQPMSIVAKWSPTSATAELLSYSPNSYYINHCTMFYSVSSSY